MVKDYKDAHYGWNLLQVPKQIKMLLHATAVVENVGIIIYIIMMQSSSFHAFPFQLIDDVSLSYE